MLQSQLPQGVKDIAKVLKGTNYGLAWMIITYLTDEGEYYSTVTVKPETGNTRSQDTLKREDLDTAVADGGLQLNEYIELMGVHHAA